MRCGSCKKIIWPWQKRMKVKWVVKPNENPEGVTVLYHNPKCLSPDDFLTSYKPPVFDEGIEKAMQKQAEYMGFVKKAGD